MKQVDVTEPALLFRIAKLYNERMSDDALYECTRGVWKLSERREAVRYVFAVANGLVQEVFVVGQWYPAGTTEYATRKFTEVQVKGRWEFTGLRAPKALRDKYVGHSVAHYFPRGASNPVRYLNT